MYNQKSIDNVIEFGEKCIGAFTRARTDKWYHRFFARTTLRSAVIKNMTS